MAFLFRIIMMVALLAGVVFSIYKLNTSGIDPAIFYLDANSAQSFQTDQVTHFEWKSYDKLFAYDRDSKGNWLPEKNAKNLKDLLTFLSQIQLNNVEQKGKSFLDVALDIEGVRWTGSWDGLSFVWKSGPNQGKGEILAEKKNRVFFKGKHVFDLLEINLCRNRIQKIQFSNNGKSYAIEQAGSGWKITPQEEQSPNAVFIEKWLIGLCQIKTKTLVDSAYAQGDKITSAIDFEFVDGSKDVFLQVEGDLFMHKNMGVVAEGLSNSLEQLKKEITSPGKP